MNLVMGLLNFRRRGWIMVMMRVAVDMMGWRWLLHYRRRWWVVRLWRWLMMVNLWRWLMMLGLAVMFLMMVWAVMHGMFLLMVMVLLNEGLMQASMVVVMRHSKKIIV
jgi:hypothetical protein